MKAFVIVSTVVFGLISVAHVWRSVVEPHLVREPWYILTSLVGIALFLWGFRLLWQQPKM
jgi:hypothetical protein